MARETLEDVEEKCMLLAKEFNATIDFRQSNHEGAIN